MTTLKLSGQTIEIPINLNKTVTVNKIQINGFETKVQFINLSGVILHSFICSTIEADNYAKVIARERNYKIVE